MLLSLPTELVLHILQLALETNPPTPLCLVNSQLLFLTQTLLHGQLRFRSGLQLTRFANNLVALVVQPRIMTVELPGGTVDPNLFENIGAVFKKCTCGLHAYSPGLDANASQVLLLSTLSLRLNSHTSDPRPSLIYDALSFVSPHKFSWTGPDPDHHFSNAIVPTAAYHLLRAIDRWSHLQELILASISFKFFDELDRESPLQGRLPHLQRISFRQAIFLAPRHIVAILLAQPGVVQMRLIDAYRTSIWGPRIRRSDIEQAALESTDREKMPLQLVERVQTVVSCEKKTERIVGGDRVADDVVFLY